MLSANQRLAAERQVDLLGRSLVDLAAAARRELLSMARRYSASYGVGEELLSAGDSSPLILSGHQPQLFHPGVWFKNFLLSSLGQRFRASAINLVIDNDLARNTAIHVPTHGADLTCAAVEFDAFSDPVPYEERSLLNPAQFQDFPGQVTRLLSQLPKTIANYTPLVGPLWDQAQIVRRETGWTNLGRIIAAARHRLEHRAGLKTWELPLGAVSATTEFRWFLLHLLTNLARFQSAYNSQLAVYRAANRIRSQSHPVPALTVNQDWLEAPVWIWSARQPQRQRLFVRQITGELQLGGFNDRPLLTLPLHDFPQRAIGQLEEAEQRGVKLRPRALLTTMYARLALSDLFLHGIGGAKYDELTDAIMGRFLGCPAPAFLTATATLQLPVAGPTIAAGALPALDRRLRDLTHAPETFSPELSAAAPNFRTLAAEKRALITEGWQRGGKPAWHAHVQRCNERLTALLADERQRLIEQRNQLLDDLRRAQVVGSREYSFCLFPAETLPPQLERLAAT